MHALLAAAATTLVLNEVLYDPPGPDGGREFVEILALAPVALDGWTLEAGDGARATWRVVWRGSGPVAAGAFAVIGGDSVPGTAGRLAADLQNGPDALRLVDPAGVVHDRVGWGALADTSFFETRPAPDVSGVALSRDPDGRDSDDNGADFTAAPPSPGRSNRPARDLALRVVPPDPLYAWPGRLVRAAIAVRNRGREPAAAWDVAAWWTDVVSGAVSPIAVGGARGAAIAPGDSATVVCAVSGGAGLYRLAVRLVPADDDSTNDAAAVFVRIGAGDVVLDEILYAPRPGESEWVELWNRAPHPVALAGFTLEDRTARRGTVRGEPVLAPGERCIVAADTASIAPEPVAGTLRIVLSSWPSLNDTGDGWADALVLRDASGVPVDACGYPPRAGARGRSLERLAPDPDARGVEWVASAAQAGATPGAAQHGAAGASPVAGSALDLVPNPFAPGSGGAGDRVLVHARVPDAYDGFRLEIYDLEGRRRARLGADAAGPGLRRVGWDGRDESGSFVEAGAYIVLFECHSKSRPVFRVKRALGVVRP